MTWSPAGGPTVLIDWWQARSLLVRDGLLAVALAAAAFAPGLVDNGVLVGELPPRALDASGFVLVMGQCLPLALRRVRPALCLTLVAACFAAVQLITYPSTFASVGLLVALYSAGAHQDRLRKSLLGAATAGYALLAIALNTRGSSEQFADFAAFYLMLLAFAGVGALMRSQRRSETQRRRRAAELAATRERNKIARDLHDVVTHHVTAMVVQADAARLHPGAKHTELTTGLSAISDTGRRAMTDLRRLLGVLDNSGAPTASDQPPAQHQDEVCDSDLDRVEDLVEQVRRTGQPVELTIRGSRPMLAAEVDLTAHRVAQEALTNAVKYAHGHPTAVAISYTKDCVDIQVSTDGGGPAPVPDLPSGGRGLHGLCERVQVLGGEFTAGDRPQGGFVVRARLPLGRHR